MTDYTVGDTLFIAFTTRAFATGIPTALAGSPVVSAYEDAGLTQITAGITLGVDHDSVAGLNMLTIVATGANGYEAGKDYHMVVTTGTVGGVSVVGEVVGRFTLGRSAAAVDLANVTDGLGAIKAETAAILVDTGTTLDAALAVVDANVDAILVDTAEIGAAGAGLTALATPTNITAGTITNLTNERGKYAGGAVWIGPTANTNTVSYVDGIITNPVSTIAAAKTIADALNLRVFHTVRTGASQIAAAMTGYEFMGDAWSLTTTGGSRDVGTSVFHNAELAGGTFAGTTGRIVWDKCSFPVAVSVGVSTMGECLFGNTLTLSEAGDYNFIDCASVVAGAGAPTFALGAGAFNISIRRWSGGITFSGITADDVLTISGELGTIDLGSPSGAADIQIRGTYKAITNVGSAVVNLTGAILGADVASILVDTAEIGAAGAGLTNINLPNQTMDIVGNITGNLSGSVGSVTGAVGSVTGAVGSVTGHTNQTGDSFAIVNGAAGLVAIDTVVDAIKVKTDSLTFTVANVVDANTLRINGAALVGDGNATPWDGA